MPWWVPWRRVNNKEQFEVDGPYNSRDKAMDEREKMKKQLGMSFIIGIPVEADTRTEAEELAKSPPAGLFL